nr:hypothetical protein [Candidatus Sigynarchaeota archaeon]
MSITESQIEKELISLGFQDIKHDGARFPVITGHRKTGVYDIEVRMELGIKPTAVISGKNGCSMKFRVEDEHSVERTFKALRALNEGKAFNQLWNVLLS